MPTFYVGHRPVLRGRDGDTFGPDGEETVYSYYPFTHADQALAGMPDKPSHVPGTGRHPNSVQLSGWFLGTLHQNTPMDNPGDGARQDPYFNRQQPYLYKGLVSTQALAGPHFGHAHGINGAYARFSNISGFKGVPSANATLNGGHAQRAYGAGAAFMGPTHKFEYQGVTARPMDEPGRDYPEGRYGHEKHQEWFGVPSAQAL